MNRKFFIFIILLSAAFFFAGNARAQHENQSNIIHFYVGTYTDGESEGIYRYGLDLSNGMLKNDGLAAMSENPSYLTKSNDNKHLLSVRETADEKGNKTGYIELFSVTENGQLVPVNKVSSGGAHPCHVSVNKNGFVLASNYTGGTVALFKILPSGELSEPLSVIQHVGKGPDSGRQEKPHVHSAIFEPDGERIFVADLGIDRVKVYRIDTLSSTLKPCRYPEIIINPGGGPRHMAIHPNGKILVVANEMLSKVSVISIAEKNGYKTLKNYSTIPADFNLPNTSADIHFSPDGKYLYVSNRGLNSIAIFSFDATTNNLVLLQQESTMGETPRNFTLTPDGNYLLVANQNSDNIVCFKRDSTTGMLNFTSQLHAFKPVCLLFNN